MSGLPQETARRIKQLCADAYSAYDDQDYKTALRTFYQGWLLLPKPQPTYPEAGWLLTGIGDTYFRLQQYQPACEALRSADCCEAAMDNPFIHLRLGQCLYQLQQTQCASKHLLKAYRAGGAQIFANEPAIYLQLIGKHIATTSACEG